MIINEFNIDRHAIFPAKTNTPLPVDAYTPLFPAPALQFLKTIAGRDAQIFQQLGVIQVQEPKSRRIQQIWMYAFDYLVIKNGQGALIFESSRHT
jgi:hypothetical protein